jgi:hypothetical protein
MCHLLDQNGVILSSGTPPGNAVMHFLAEKSHSFTRNGFHNTAWGRRIAAHPRYENGDITEPQRATL